MAFEALQEMRKLSSNQEALLKRLQEQQVATLRRDRWFNWGGLGCLVVAGFWVLKPELIPSVTEIPLPAWGFGIAGMILIASKNFPRRL